MSWLDRQSFLGTDSDSILSGTTVGIVGLGGGGSHVVQQLAHLGVGRFVLIDPDEVSESNLNRLVGATREDADNGALKIAVAVRLIRAVNPGAIVSSHCEPWQVVADSLLDCDAVFGCLDNVRGKAELEAFCRRMLIPMIDQGMDVFELGSNGDHLIAGQVVLSMPDKPCLRCFGVVTDDALDEEGRNYGAAGGKPQVVWPNGLLASSAVGLFVSLVTPWQSAEATPLCLEYDGNRQTLNISDRVRRLPNGPCRHFSPCDLGTIGFDIRQAPINVLANGPREQRPLRPWWRRIFARIGRGFLRA